MARVVVQRVRSASVDVGDERVASIGPGCAILVGIAEDDTASAVEHLADKVAVLRIFADETGKMNRSAAEASGDMLVISQFTLYGDVRKGRRPSFTRAAHAELGEQLYQRFVQRLAHHGYHVARGRFGAHMVLTLENDGPVTLIIDSSDL